MSEIKNENVVEIDYTLKNDQGAILDSSEGAKPLSFIMGKKNIIPASSQQLPVSPLEILFKSK